MSELNYLNYLRVEANPSHPYIKVKAVAHEAVVIYCEPPHPNPGTNEGFVVRLARL